MLPAHAPQHATTGAAPFVEPSGWELGFALAGAPSFAEPQGPPPRPPVLGEPGGAPPRPPPTGEPSVTATDLPTPTAGDRVAPAGARRRTALPVVAAASLLLHGAVVAALLDRDPLSAARPPVDVTSEVPIDFVSEHELLRQAVEVETAALATPVDTEARADPVDEARQPAAIETAREVVPVEDTGADPDEAAPVALAYDAASPDAEVLPVTARVAEADAVAPLAAAETVEEASPRMARDAGAELVPDLAGAAAVTPETGGAAPAPDLAGAAAVAPETEVAAPAPVASASTPPAPEAFLPAEVDRVLEDEVDRGRPAIERTEVRRVRLAAVVEVRRPVSRGVVAAATVGAEAATADAPVVEAPVVVAATEASPDEAGETIAAGQVIEDVAAISPEQRMAAPQRPAAKPVRTARAETKTPPAARSRAAVVFPRGYARQMASHLRRYLPRAATLSQRQAARTAVVTFSVDRRGITSNLRFVRRTGSLALDREVVRVIQRASPFPRIPGLSGSQTVTIRTPVPVVPR